MRNNTFREEEKTKQISWFKKLTDKLNIDFGIKELPDILYDRILWIAGLLVVYIFLQHNYERLFRNIENLKAEVDDLRANYITEKSKYMLQSKQSELAEKVKETGIEESIVPPKKIIAKPE
jgi:hypothetical protein